MQEARLGGLSPKAQKRLRDLGAAFARNPDHQLSSTLGLKPGSALVREWKGIRHHVYVLDDGFAYRGARYATLSEAARTITGSRWSGPRFFGLTDKLARLEDPA